MSGPTLVIELAQAPAPAALREFGALMTRLCPTLTENRPGSYDGHVLADRLGIPDRPEWAPPPRHQAPADPAPAALRRPGLHLHRPFLVYLMGPGIGDEPLFEAEHADQPALDAALGYRPTHAVNVSACCNDDLDHLATALLTAAVMDAVGGLAAAELATGQAGIVAGLPGLLAVTEDDWPTAVGTAAFLRAWAEQPGFRLMK
ncbi:DUF6368 family protein [Kitasatospora sp. NPDC059646]|uniref:DUF6368 family protein n=1 Tax=Kitasatospora sp. NPDC059646 TaxID=3346893 RepID=UPI0036A8DD44